jgi:zinc and cadmium transporter
VTPAILALLAVTGVSLLSLLGAVTIGMGQRRVEALSLHLVAFAVGALLGDAFLHLMPEAFVRMGPGRRAPLLAIAGVLLFYLVERLVRSRHDGEGAGAVKPYVLVVLVGDGVHNFFDGAIIAASFLVSRPLGVTTTLAVVLHEIPHELGDFGALVRGGLTVRRAIFWNFVSALTAELGAIAGLVAGTRVHEAAVELLPMTAGGFVYVACADLVPELLAHRGRRDGIIHLALMCAGVVVMALLR